MKSIIDLLFLRPLLWRLGRRIYTAARADNLNNPDKNGEYWLLQKVLENPTPEVVLLDVGANKGNWSAKATEMAGETQVISIHAFEPSLETRMMLTRRFADSKKVMVHHYALSDSEGEAEFYSEEAGGGTNSLSSSSGSKSETVTLTTIDLFLQQNAIVGVSMVKIDTEGFDFLVLRGAANAIDAEKIDVLQFEYNWRWLQNHVSLRDVFELISDKPYRLGKLIGGGIEFYEEWHFELDRFFENNYVLIRKSSKLCSLGRSVRFDRNNVGRPG